MLYLCILDIGTAQTAFTPHELGIIGFDKSGSEGEEIWLINLEDIKRLTSFHIVNGRFTHVDNNEVWDSKTLQTIQVTYTGSHPVPRGSILKISSKLSVSINGEKNPAFEVNWDSSASLLGDGYNELYVMQGRLTELPNNSTILKGTLLDKLAYGTTNLQHSPNAQDLGDDASFLRIDDGGTFGADPITTCDFCELLEALLNAITGETTGTGVFGESDVTIDTYLSYLEDCYGANSCEGPRGELTLIAEDGYLQLSGTPCEEISSFTVNYEDEEGNSNTIASGIDWDEFRPIRLIDCQGQLSSLTYTMTITCSDGSTCTLELDVPCIRCQSSITDIIITDDSGACVLEAVVANCPGGTLTLTDANGNSYSSQDMSIAIPASGQYSGVIDGCPDCDPIHFSENIDINGCDGCNATPTSAFVVADCDIMVTISNCPYPIISFIDPNGNVEQTGSSTILNNPNMQGVYSIIIDNCPDCEPLEISQTVTSCVCSPTLNLDLNGGCRDIYASVDDCNGGTPTYVWSTGETGSSILPPNPGTYCVTVNGCCEPVSDCFSYSCGCPNIIASSPNDLTDSCEDIIQINFSDGEGQYSYTSSNSLIPNGSIPDGGTIDVSTLFQNESITFVFTDANGCPADTITYNPCPYDDGSGNNPVTGFYSVNTSCSVFNHTQVTAYYEGTCGCTGGIAITWELFDAAGNLLCTGSYSNGNRCFGVCAENSPFDGISINNNPDHPQYCRGLVEGASYTLVLTDSFGNMISTTFISESCTVSSLQSQSNNTIDQGNVAISIVNDLDEKISTELSIYPNPSNDKIIVEYPSLTSSLVITDKYGRVIVMRQVESLDPGSLKFDLTPFPEGLYFCKAISTERTNQSSKFTIIR